MKKCFIRSLKIIIKWDNSNWNKLEECQIQDIGGGSLGVNIDMLKESTYTLTNTDITKLKLKLKRKN